MKVNLDRDIIMDQVDLCLEMEIVMMETGKKVEWMVQVHLKEMMDYV